MVLRHEVAAATEAAEGEARGESELSALDHPARLLGGSGPVVRSRPSTDLYDRKGRTLVNDIFDFY